MITGVEEGRDDVSIPDSIVQGVETDFGKKIADGFRDFFHFDPPQNA